MAQVLTDTISINQARRSIKQVYIEELLGPYYQAPSKDKIRAARARTKARRAAGQPPLDYEAMAQSKASVKSARHEALQAELTKVTTHLIAHQNEQTVVVTLDWEFDDRAVNQITNHIKKSGWNNIKRSFDTATRLWVLEISH